MCDFGYRVDPAKDQVQYDGQTIRMNDLRYVLLNKPEYTVATDGSTKRTAFQLLRGA